MINDQYGHIINERHFNRLVSYIEKDKVAFDGVGNSGIGGYHGKYSFYEFSHCKSIVKRLIGLIYL